MEHARFVARYRRFGHAIQPEVSVLHDRPTGVADKEIKQREIFVFFNPALVNDDDFAVGATQLVHVGLPEQDDREVSPRSRLAVFDTRQWQIDFQATDEEVAKAISVLRDSSLYGIDFVEVTPKPADLPWRGYDETPEDKILELALATGTPIDDVLQYERENANRKSVVVQLELGEQSTDESPVVVQA